MRRVYRAERRKLDIGPQRPVACKTQIPTATTTTTFRIVLMLEAMGMKRLISHNPIPTTISAMTRFIKGMCLYSSALEQAIGDPNFLG